MNHGSLFSGIGGFDLAAQWMGWENIFHCEKEPFPRHVLHYYWPQATSYEDITTTDFSIHRGTIDILTGGFPCQPYSSAGKRLGSADSRHLWPEMLRAIREISPRWVVAENVRGLTNWNAGLVFNEVQADLEAEGYEVLPFLLPACGVGAPHRRDRIWFIAHRTDAGPETVHQPQVNAHGFETATNSKYNGVSNNKLYNQTYTDTIGIIEGRPDAYTNGFGWAQGDQGQQSEIKPSQDVPDWRQFPTQSPVCGRNDGFPPGLVSVTGSSGKSGTRRLNESQANAALRRKAIKAYGNAIVPQVALQIFRSIAAFESL